MPILSQMHIQDIQLPATALAHNNSGQAVHIHVSGSVVADVHLVDLTSHQVLVNDVLAQS